ncbi:hypothetical protein VMCG_10242 [Cytospora schulzeri]|uniref:DUF6546 domain-containing protein n=1 Tax=Cytospora schulzeri TaxID=448051 RepID=A0A423VGY4_9PEZI|nr:hypothetical protein VMCG_10242 [Valsa malicola]
MADFGIKIARLFWNYGPGSIIEYLWRLSPGLFRLNIAQRETDCEVMADHDEWEDVEMTGQGSDEEEDEEEDVVEETIRPIEARPTRPTPVTTTGAPETDEVDEDINPNVSWDRLPYELSHKILQTLAEDELDSRLLAEYAVVCRSWQAEIEKVNFRTLAVKQMDLHDLEQYVTGHRRACLKHLWLKVELAEYSRRASVVPESEQEQEENNYRYSRALFDLFKILESWDTPGFWESRNGRGLSLELSAFSPSDRLKMFGEAGLDDDGNSRYFDSLLDFMLLALDEPEGIHGLPMVNVVTAFSILRRNYRNMSATSLTPIFNSLPRLEEVRLEPWQQVDQPAQQDVDSELATQMPFWPTNLKRVSIFEHFGAFDQNDAWDTRIRFPFLAHGLRRLSTNLEELSVSFSADARDFFDPYIKHGGLRNPQWTNLRWLTLTSRFMTEVAFPDEINNMLRGAGLAAKDMPALQAMEIYSATKWDAGVFRYLIVNNTGIISWTSTWEHKIPLAVKTAWRLVALQHTRRELYVFDEVKLPGYPMGPEGFIHSELATREMVLHPISSAEMMGERHVPDPVLKLAGRC